MGNLTQLTSKKRGIFYGVTVTDANGCQGTDSLAVTVNANPTVTITATPGATVCDGTTVTLDAGAGFASYLWSPGGETTQTIDVTTGNTYGVTVTDANGPASGSVQRKPWRAAATSRLRRLLA